MQFLREGRPHIFLQQLFVILNRFDHSFTFGDLSVYDPEGKIHEALATGDRLVNGDIEIALKSPVVGQCKCSACKGAEKPITHLHIRRLPHDFLLIRLRNCSEFSLYGMLETAKLQFFGTAAKNPGCSSRYSLEQYCMFETDATFLSNVAFDKEQYAVYNRRVRLGNELLVCFACEI